MGNSFCQPHNFAQKYEIYENPRIYEDHLNDQQEQTNQPKHRNQLHLEYANTNTFEDTSNKIEPKGNIYDFYKPKSKEPIIHYKMQKKEHRRMTNNINPNLNHGEYHRSKTQKLNKKQDVLSIQNYSQIQLYYQGEYRLSKKSDSKSNNSNKLSTNPQQNQPSLINIHLSSSYQN